MKANRRAKKEKNTGWRMQFLLTAIFLLFGVIFARLCQLQIFEHGDYAEAAQNQHEDRRELVAQRGRIYMKDDAGGNIYPVAVNKELHLVYAEPANIEAEDREAVAKRVSEILQLDYGEVLAKVSKSDDHYEILKKKVSDEDAAAIREEKLSGIKIDPDTFRYYPGGELAANIIGFLGYSDTGRVGQYGIEGYSEKDLAGESGYVQQEEANNSGAWISFGDKTESPAQDGKDVVLTLDYTVQYMVEQKLKAAVEKFEAESGTVIVMDPETGEIIAMADFPTYDLNKYSEVEDMSVFMNSAVHSLYEPGSIEKPITMAIGLDTGRIIPSSTYVDSGLVQIDGWGIRNSDLKANGLQTMTQIMEKSLNTGTIYIQQKVEKKVFYEYLQKFGLGSPTGVEITGESGGNLSNLDTYSDINYATASFGQGISVTPLGILTAISIFANDGKLMKPYIIDSYIDVNGAITKTEPEIVRQVVSARTANQVAAMMVSVVDNGHSKGAQLPGYKIAGKTGTAQIPSRDKKGYDADRTIHTFVGFGPMPNPKFSILVKLDAPHAQYAESTSVKLFKEIEDELVKYYHLAPTEEIVTAAE